MHPLEGQMDTKTSGQIRRINLREEPVINNAVLYVYKDIINEFIFTVRSLRGLKSVCVLEDLTKIPRCASIYKDYHNTYPEHIKVNIRDKMVVHISDTAAYYYRNVENYGPCIDVIRKEAKRYMQLRYQGNLQDAQRHVQQISREVYEMNKKLLYVDEEALNHWQNSEEDNNGIYLECKDYVRLMFKNLPHKLDQWVDQISMYYPLLT